MNTKTDSEPCDHDCYQINFDWLNFKCPNCLRLVKKHEWFARKAAPKNQDTQPECDCHLQYHQVCDICQGVAPKNQDTQPEGVEERFKGTFSFINHCKDSGCHHIYDDIGNEGNLDDVLAFLKQEIAAAEERAYERVIAEIPDGCDDYTCDRADCMEPTKQQLRAKYLDAAKAIVDPREKN